MRFRSNARSSYRCSATTTRSAGHERKLEAEVFDFDPLTVNEALMRLEAEGVVILDGENVEASRCARRMDALELVSI
jgi:hypothetical protein